MRNRIPVIIAVVSVICVLCGIGLVIYAHSLTVYTGIETFTDQEKMAQADIILESVLMQSSERSIEEELTNDADRISEKLDNASAILLVETDGGIYQYQGSFAQNLTVIKVIKCDDARVDEGSHIQLFRYFGMNYDNGTITFYSNRNLNILYPGNTYLVFLDESKASKYSDIPYFSLLLDEYCAIINTDRTKTLNLCASYEFNECKDVMHFTASEKIAQLFAQREEIILGKYLP